MKKPLYSINNEKGFILPYVLFMVFLLFILITSSIKTYQNDIYLTDHYLEHLRIETLFQRGKMKFSKEVLSSSNPFPPTTNYEFNDGYVTIQVREVSDKVYEIVYNITTKELEFSYNFHTTYNPT